MKPLLDPILPSARFGPSDRALTVTMWLVGFVQGFTQAQPAATLPFTRAGLGLSQADISSLLAWARLGSLLAVGLSIWADRSGRRRPLLAAYALLVVASAAGGLVTSPLQFGLSQGLVRGATSGLSTLGVVWLAEHLAPRIRAYGVGIYGAAGSFGAGLAVIGLPLAEANWRIPYFLTGAGLLLLPVLAYRIREPKDRGTIPARRVDTSFLQTPVFLVAALTSLLPSAFSSLGLAFLTERLVNQVGLSSGEAVLLTLSGGTVGAVGFFLGGRLADTWGRRPTTILALLSILGGGVAVYNLGSVSLLFPALIVSSFGSFAYVPAASIHRAELFRPEQRATASSALTWVGTLGSAIGLLTGGLMIDRLGLSATMALLGSAVLVAALLTLRLPETRGLLLDRWEDTGEKDQQAGQDHESDRPPDAAQPPTTPNDDD